MPGIFLATLGMDSGQAGMTAIEQGCSLTNEFLNNSYLSHNIYPISSCHQDIYLFLLLGNIQAQGVACGNPFSITQEDLELLGQQESNT